MIAPYELKPIRALTVIACLGTFYGDKLIVPSLEEAVAEVYAESRLDTSRLEDSEGEGIDFLTQCLALGLRASRAEEPMERIPFARANPKKGGPPRVANWEADLFDQLKEEFPHQGRRARFASWTFRRTGLPLPWARIVSTSDVPSAKIPERPIGEAARKGEGRAVVLLRDAREGRRARLLPRPTNSLPPWKAFGEE